MQIPEAHSFTTNYTQILFQEAAPVAPHSHYYKFLFA